MRKVLIAGLVLLACMGQASQPGTRAATAPVTQPDMKARAEAARQAEHERQLKVNAALAAAKLKAQRQQVENLKPGMFRADLPPFMKKVSASGTGEVYEWTYTPAAPDAAQIYTVKLVDGKIEEVGQAAPAGRGRGR